MRVLWLCIVVSWVSTVEGSSLLSKTINADGTKEFRIAKHIKHNTCLCQCRCVPETLDLFANKPVMGAASTEFTEIDEGAVKEEQNLGTSLKQDLATVTPQQNNETKLTTPTSISPTEKEVQRVTTGATTATAVEGLSPTDIPVPKQLFVNASKAFGNASAPQPSPTTDVVPFPSKESARTESSASVSEISPAPLVSKEPTLEIKSTSTAASSTTTPLLSTGVTSITVSIPENSSSSITQQSNGETKLTTEYDTSGEPSATSSTTEGAMSEFATQSTAATGANPETIETLFTESIEAIETTLSSLESTTIPTTTTLEELFQRESRISVDSTITSSPEKNHLTDTSTRASTEKNAIFAGANTETSMEKATRIGQSVESTKSTESQSSTATTTPSTVTDVTSLLSSTVRSTSSEKPEISKEFAPVLIATTKLTFVAASTENIQESKESQAIRITTNNRVGSTVSLGTANKIISTTSETSTERTSTTTEASTMLSLALITLKSPENISKSGEDEPFASNALNNETENSTTEVVGVDSSTISSPRTTAESSSATATATAASSVITAPSVFTDSTTISFNVDSVVDGFKTRIISSNTTTAKVRIKANTTEAATSPSIAEEGLRTDQSLDKNPTEKTGRKGILRAKIFTPLVLKQMTKATETTSTTAAETTTASAGEQTAVAESTMTTDEEHQEKVAVAVTEEASEIQLTLSPFHVSTQPHKDLPERWKGLVMRLKKKLEELKTKKGLMSLKNAINITKIPNAEGIPFPTERSSFDSAFSTESTKTYASTKNQDEINVTRMPAIVELSPSTTEPTPTTFKWPSSTDSSSTNNGSTSLQSNPHDFHDSTEQSGSKIVNAVSSNEASNVSRDTDSATTVASEVVTEVDRGESSETIGFHDANDLTTRNDGIKTGTRTVSEAATSLTSGQGTSGAVVTTPLTTIAKLLTNDSASDVTVLPTTAAAVLPFKAETTESSAALTKTSTSLYTFTAGETIAAIENSASTTSWDVTITTPSSEEFVEAQATTDLTTAVESSTTFGTTEVMKRDRDKESVGGFVLSNDATSSEEVTESQSPKNLRVTLKETVTSSPEDKIIPFTIGQPSREKTDLLSSLIKSIMTGVTQAASTSAASVIEQATASTVLEHISDADREAKRSEGKFMAESGEFEKRIREERIRYEQAKQLHENQRQLEQQKESDNERILREELKKRSEEMKRRLEELKAAELRRQSALEQRQQEEEERLRQIAEKHEEEKFAEYTSTDLPVIDSVTKKITYMLRPSQCAAINKFTRVFKITDPSSWIARNCQFAKRYFPQASCPQIQSLIESCFAIF